MSLNITRFDNGGLSSLNRWASQRQNDLNAHAKQIQQLQKVIQQLISANNLKNG